MSAAQLKDDNASQTIVHIIGCILDIFLNTYNWNMFNNWKNHKGPYKLRIKHRYCQWYNSYMAFYKHLFFPWEKKKKKQ